MSRFHWVSPGIMNSLGRRDGDQLPAAVGLGLGMERGYFSEVLCPSVDFCAWYSLSLLTPRMLDA